jgi:uncharacterized protein YbcC (UPF0753/DUF2309 family)
MKKILICLIFASSLSLGAYSVTNNIFEQVALNYFCDTIAENFPDYKKIKYFIFNGRIEKESAAYANFCMWNLSENENTNMTILSTDYSQKLTIPPCRRIIKSIPFYKRIFLEEKQIKKIWIYSALECKEGIIVSITIDSDFNSDFFTILIDKESKQVINHCVSKYVV